VPLLLLSALAAQGSVVLAVSERHDLGVTGTFARAVPLSDGWWLTWGAGGDLLRAPLTEDGGWAADDRERIGVLGRDDLVDHGLVRCPDDTWLHVGSQNVLAPNDSSAAHWLDAELGLIQSQTIEEEVPERAHNDPAVVCGQDFVGVTHTSATPGDPSWFFPLTDGAVGSPVELAESPRTPGAGLLQDGERLLLVSTWNFVRELQVNTYDADLGLLTNPLQTPVLADDEEIWWPTGLVRVGSHFLVATMGKQLEEGWAADTGQVWLLVLDLDLAVVEEVPISALSLPDGAMRPWLVRDGDRLLLTADVAIRPALWEITLDLEALGPEPADTGGDAGTPAQETCGCAQRTPAGVWLWGLGCLVLVTRRSPRSRAAPGAPEALAELGCWTPGAASCHRAPVGTRRTGR